ncbi:MAG TPA: rhomboid family intramembrane serine protease [Allosphingosinicella sp.]|jgi:membrane associated rhomboid family serine protease
MRPPEDWRHARLTLAIAGVTAAAWFFAWGLGLSDAAAVRGGFIPWRVQGVVEGAVMVPAFLTPLSATLVHGGLMHVMFNLLILLFCGRSTETIIGSRQLAILYVVGAYAAAAAQYATDPSDMTPMVGASGAISAVLGAYAMLFGRNRVKVQNQKLALLLNALWLAAGWIVLQLIVGFTFQGTAMRIAIAAHVGGFLAGILLARPLLLLRYRKA